MNATSPLNESLCVYLSNALNEVLNGFRVDFENTLGSRQEDVSQLFQKLSVLCDGKALHLERISLVEAKLLLKCSNLCLQELDADEFETRLGESPEVARQVNHAISSYVGTVSLSS